MKVKYNNFVAQSHPFKIITIIGESVAKAHYKKLGESGEDEVRESVFIFDN